MDRPVEELRILMLEDVRSDAELVEAELRDGGLAFSSLRVVTRDAFERALVDFRPDIILADYRLPTYSGRDALEYARRTHPGIPVIMVTGALGDEAAVELLKLGANDYVLKDGLARLASAIKRALAEERGIRSRKLVEAALRESEERYRSIFENARDIIFTVSATATVATVSPSFELVTGWPCAEWLGRAFFPLVHPDELPTAMHLFQRALHGETLPLIELGILKKSGEYLNCEFTIAPLAHEGKITQLLGIARDITERKRAERLLHESELRYRRLFEAAKDGILILDAETGVIVDANPFLLDLLSYDRSECVGKRLWEIGLFADTEASKAAFGELQTQGHIRYEDLPLETKDGARRDVEFISNVYEVDGRKVIQCNIRDITERKAAELQLRLSAQLLDSAADSIIAFNLDGSFVYANEAAWRTRGYTHDELMAISLQQLDAMGDDKFIEGKMAELMEKGVMTLETAHRRKDGSVMPIEVHARLIELGGRQVVLSSSRDITERKLAEERLRQNEHSLKEAQRIAHLGSWNLDFDKNALTWSDEIYQIFEIDPEKFGATYEAFLNAIHPDDRELVNNAYTESVKNGAPYGIEHRLLMKDGRIKYVKEVGETYYDENRKPSRSFGIVHDITERKQAEEALRRSNRALQTLSAGNLALVRSSSEEELLRAATSIIVEVGGYKMAAVGYSADDRDKSITPMAWSGLEGSQYWAERLTWADTEQGQLPISRAIRSGTTQVCHDIANDPAFKPWRDALLPRGYASNIALPLSDGDRIFGGLSIFSSELVPFDDEEVRLLEELAGDLAYGIATLRARAERDQHTTVLRQSLEQSIETIAATVEARDPYTAGHQRRVAELATAIAREMGLPEEQVNGIHLAAIIHDLGKINIPAEILSTPTPLTDIEFMLIKIHPQAGYDILKGVRFPWPIADIIQQHHERLDGSGYPHGLKGEQILLESRIIAVADVVESMASDRPYRPAKGITAALEEIARGQGSLYDPAVGNVCTKLFADKGFSFGTEGSAL